MASEHQQSGAAKKTRAGNQLLGDRSVVGDKDRDAALVADCLEGNRNAMSTLVTHYEKPVFNAAFRILGNGQDAADATQTAFLKAFENLRNYDPRYKFFSWLYKITVNESISALKSRRPSVSLEYAEPGNTPGPEPAVISDAVGRTVQEVLMNLPDEQRVLVALKHFSELSYRDIAAILDIPEKTVKSRLYSARQTMKKDLLARGVTPE